MHQFISSFPCSVNSISGKRDRMVIYHVILQSKVKGELIGFWIAQHKTIYRTNYRYHRLTLSLTSKYQPLFTATLAKFLEKPIPKGKVFCLNSIRIIEFTITLMIMFSICRNKTKKFMERLKWFIVSFQSDIQWCS